MLIKELIENLIIAERYEYIDAALEKYKDDENIYIHYSDIPKLGINPQTSFDTPAGIYAYPLKEMYEAVKLNAIPFAGNRRFVVVFKNTGGKILDMSKYSQANYATDMAIIKNKLSQELKNTVDSSIVADPIQFIERSKKTAKPNIPAAWTWNTTRRLAQSIEQKTRQKQTVVWTSLLTRTLGYYGAVDKTGTGTIHEAEPTQAVFFSTQHLKLLEITINKSRRLIPNKLDNHLYNYKKTGIKPNEELMISAVKNHGPAIAGIISAGIMPSPRVQLAAVKQHSEVIGYLIDKKIIPSKNAWVDEKIMLAAVQHHPDALAHIIDAGITPSEAVKQAANKGPVSP
jgi:hypothetical protein